MKERPLRCKGWEVRAILAGRKTQMRRVVKIPVFHPLLDRHIEWYDLSRIINELPKCCPYGQPGERLWCKETYAAANSGFHESSYVAYKADRMFDGCKPGDISWKWQPSIHMPRWASRITLEITGVRVERLNDISEEDAIAEGIDKRESPWNQLFWKAYHPVPHPSGNGNIVGFTSPKRSFQTLWESTNGPKSWNRNDWVWAIEFKHL